jgi:hypothetical protein
MKVMLAIGWERPSVAILLCVQCEVDTAIPDFALFLADGKPVLVVLLIKIHRIYGHCEYRTATSSSLLRLLNHYNILIYGSMDRRLALHCLACSLHCITFVPT